YGYILGRIQTSLASWLPGIERAGTSDLAAAGRKFSGNAQQRKRRFLLHHGTLLYDFDLAQVGRYLLMPERQPAYREGRAHSTFLCNFPAGGAALNRAPQSRWAAARPRRAWPHDLVDQLTEDKYLRPDWVYRR